MIKIKREKTLSGICAVGAAVNILLFFTKLYVGLSSNSISIFSDSINSLADCLSCLLGVIGMAAASRFEKEKIFGCAQKTEQLLSFVLSIVVAIVGFAFAYSSLERLMYPTPVWFEVRYFAVIAATAAVKLAMFFFYRAFSKKYGSPIIKVMTTDSIMDAGITAVTLITFTMTRFTDFTIDAACGIFISIIIIIQAIKLTISNLCGIINYVSKDKREQFKKAIFDSCGVSAEKITFDIFSDNEITAYVTIFIEDEKEFQNTAEKAANYCFEKTGIKTQFIRKPLIKSEAHT